MEATIRKKSEFMDFEFVQFGYVPIRDKEALLGFDSQSVPIKAWQRMRDVIDFNPELCRNDSSIRNKLASIQGGLENLYDILVGIAGYDMIGFRGHEEDLDAIVNRGQLWLPYGIKYMYGDKGRCHENSCALWNANMDELDIHIATGYALSENGIWSQHSWCILRDMASVKIVETTRPKRIAYFGYVMNELEAWEFYDDNQF